MTTLGSYDNIVPLEYTFDEFRDDWHSLAKGDSKMNLSAACLVLTTVNKCLNEINTDLNAILNGLT